MSNSIVPFNFEEHQVRVVAIDGEPWFVLADLCKVLEIVNVGNAAARLDDELKGVHSADTLGGRQDVTVVSEPGMYEVVLLSRKPEAKAFKRWITSEVLPTIRKTGSFGVAPALSEQEIVHQALQITVRQVKELEAKVAEDAPKVLFADSVAASRSTVLVGELAKILRGNGVEIGQNRLFERLRDEGYLIKRQGSDWNMPTQYAMELGLFEIKETAVTHSDGHVTVSKTPKVTGKGQAYFVNRYLEKAVA